MDNINNNQIRNNGQIANPLLNARDRLLHALFFKIALIYAKSFPKPVRRIIEFLILLSAFVSFLILIYIHIVFSRNPPTCVEAINDSWPRDGILRVRIVKPGVNLDPPIQISYINYHNEDEYIPQRKDNPIMNKDLSELYRNEVKEPVVNIIFDNSTLQTPFEGPDFSLKPIGPYSRRFTESQNEISLHTSPAKQDNSDSLGKKDTEEKKISTQEELGSKVEHQYVVEYSLEYGMLRLSPTTRQKLNIPVMVVTLDPKTHPCFGDILTKFILSEFLGYDDVLMSSIKRLAETEENKGYLRNVITGEQYRFVSTWMARTSYIAAFLVMLVFTVTISMLLRYSHHQIFVLIVDILQMLEFNMAVTLPASPLLTVIIALIGMDAIMSEFFNDTSTPFYIILIVWTADQYDAVFCHTSITKKYWARFFFLYHFNFYAYHYRFNGQYSGLALLTSSLFILHSMVYFFHHYELPVILQQAQLQELLVLETQGPPVLLRSAVRNEVQRNNSPSSGNVQSNSS